MASSTSISPASSASATGAQKRACDACHRRKVKCIATEGAQPCKNCALTGLACTYNAIPQKKGPKGNRAKIISELRETQNAIKSSGSASPDRTQSPHRVAPTPGLLSINHVHACVDFYYSEMYPSQLILHREQLSDIISRMEHDMEAYCLVASLCAYVSIQPDMTPQSPTEDYPTLHASGYALLKEALRLRKVIDYSEEPTVLSVMTSFFLFGSYFCIGKDAAAWYHLREATTLAHAIDMHQEESYVALDPMDATSRRRLFWLLFVTERAYALQRHKPVSLPGTINLPSFEESPTDSVELSGFLHLIRLFQPFDELFLGIWNKSRSGCTISWIVELQRQLTQCLPTYLQSTETQAVDLRISQQWLKQMVWQLSIAQGCLSSHAPDKSLTFEYPVELAKEMIGSASTFSHAAMESHGIGLVEKIFDVACTLVDVLSCVPASTMEQHNSSLQYGPLDYLHQFLNIMSSLRGGRQKYLPLLLSKVNESLPTTSREIMVPTPRTLSSSDSTGTAQIGALSLVRHQHQIQQQQLQHEDNGNEHSSASASPFGPPSPVGFTGMPVEQTLYYGNVPNAQGQQQQQGENGLYSTMYANGSAPTHMHVTPSTTPLQQQQQQRIGEHDAYVNSLLPRSEDMVGVGQVLNGWR